MIAKFVIGAAFGAALTASTVYQPEVIISQLKFQDWHMLQAFLTATACTTLIATTTHRHNLATLTPRPYAQLGWFAPYDGNLLGGLLLGAGMALSRACPGTLFAQAALGLRSGLAALQGGVLAGVVYAGGVRARVGRAARPVVPAGLEVGAGGALGGSLALYAVVVGGLAMVGPSRGGGGLSPVLGGVLIGVVQLGSVLSTGSLVGISGSFEEVGDWFWWPVRGTSGKLPGFSSILLALGVAAGSIATAACFPSLLDGAEQQPASSLAFLGGFAAVLGSRIAGGCTSGHGISGLSLYSLSSLITMAATFIGGGIVARFV